MSQFILKGEQKEIRTLLHLAYESRDQLDNKIENKSKSGEGKETKNRHGRRKPAVQLGST